MNSDAGIKGEVHVSSHSAYHELCKLCNSYSSCVRSGIVKQIIFIFLSPS